MTAKKTRKTTFYIHGVPHTVEYKDEAELGKYFLDNFQNEELEVDRTNLSLLDGATPNELAENDEGLSA